MTKVDMMHTLQAQVCGCISAHPATEFNGGQKGHVPTTFRQWRTQYLLHKTGE